MLVEAGVRLTGDYPVREPEWLPEIIRNELDKGHKLIIVGGGYGT
jgi:hypothetical protein